MTDGSRTVLAVLTRLKTIERKPRDTPSGGTYGDNVICKDSHPDFPTSFKDFIDKCGTKYLYSRQKGGYVLISVPMGQKSRETKNTVDDKLEVGSGFSDPTTVDTMMNRLVNEGIDLAFNITTTVPSWNPEKSAAWGGTKLLDSSERIHPDKWKEYSVDFLKDYQPDDSSDRQRRGYVREYNKSTSNDDFDPSHQRYGTKIDQRFRRYTEDDFNQCGQTSDIYDQYKCYSDFAMDSTRIGDDESVASKRVKKAKWKLDHPDRVRWSANPTVSATKQQYSDAVELYEECQQTSSNEVTTITEATQQCQNTFNDGDYGSLCEDCNLEKCSPEYLRNEFRQLPVATILPTANQGTPDPTYPNYSSPIPYTQDGKETSVIPNTDLSTHLCNLTRVTGHFEGGAEKIRLWAASNEWKLKTKTQQLGLMARATCAKKSIFFDEGSSDWLPERNDSVEIPSSGAKTIGLHDEPYVSALAGISGKLNGGAEFGRVEPNQPGEEELKVASNVGYMKTWSTSFGLQDPEGGMATEYASMNQSAETAGINGIKHVTQLMPAQRGVCFLTEVRGDFDGGAEEASVLRRDQHWQLQVTAGCENYCKPSLAACVSGPASLCHEPKFVKAKATCLKYDQQN